MGTGKSTAGRQAARRLGMEFLDSDHAIEAEQGRSIPDIFANEGEAAFREMERGFVDGGHPDQGCLVACGGGLAVQPGMLELLKKRGLVFALVASAEGVYERVKSSKNRPLLQVKDPLGKIRRMLEERAPVYAQADAQILTEGRTIAEVVAHLCRSYRLEAKLWRR